jgi:hypothetical protein
MIRSLARPMGRFLLFTTLSTAAVAIAARASPGSTSQTSPATWKMIPLLAASPARVALAGGIVVLVIALTWWHARHNATFRDDLLPQLPPEKQTYSLGRWQMAFWFVLVFASFVGLYVLLGDYNIVPPQALVLMGISGATALSAVGVDVAKDSPADAANRGLQALGLNSYDDVLRVEQEIAQRRSEAAGNPPALRQAQLQTEIQDRQNILLTYQDRVQPFLTEGWFKDLTTDLNGTAIHRLQVFCWTWVLGAVFVVEVIQNLKMPEFNSTLLTLMGISSAGYVGFKYPEANN